MLNISNLSRRLIYAFSAIAVVGVLFGAYFAIRGDVQPTTESPVPTIQPDDTGATFGSNFSNFIIGRSFDGSAIGGNTPIVRATKFSAGEKVGLRIQTSSDVASSFGIELRFLRQDNGEETPSLQSFRKKFTIKPGLKTYCCLAIPKEAGTFTLGILRDNAFIGTIGNIVIVPAKTSDQGSPFGL